MPGDQSRTPGCDFLRLLARGRLLAASAMLVEVFSLYNAETCFLSSGLIIATGLSYRVGGEPLGSELIPNRYRSILPQQGGHVLVELAKAITN